MTTDTKTTENCILENKKITANESVQLLCITGSEGIGDTHLGKVSFAQYCAITSIESAELDEKQRMQRLVQSSRAKGVTDYLVERNNTVFPEAVLVVGSEAVITPVNAPISKQENGTSLSLVEIGPEVDRFIVDGQGRRLGIENALALKESLAGNHLDLKVVQVATEVIYDSASFVRQIFSDFHLNLRKPSKSQSIYFDSECPLYVFTTELMTIVDRMGVPLSRAVAVEGRLSQGQFMNMATLSDFVCGFIGDTPARVKKLLADSTKYDYYLLEVARFIECLYAQFPYESLLSANKDVWKEAIDTNLSCCVIGLKALAMVGNSLHVDAQLSGKDDFDARPLAKLAELPFADREDPLWLNSQIYQRIDNKVKIVKGSERRLARLLCTQLRIIASEYCNR
ncbi:MULTISPECIES: DNA sulfur modification protein DndB [Vibrio]|uniref:DNA sulfur modification protein DndB n=1 Tax=Vibrio TaxID=662 RepID=UPI0020760291|nr:MULTISPECIES: DNA sulfur modification protein DndB [Vibrio]USD35618.1 DGQHR domain-containing protein [Vibrio sp. SCSIO 43186]USD72742.1 DGQHR domain-containing protein [Vibrio sp. SCSIO 43139]USD98947.1 hypothetical protein CTT30_23015 [Vibrio coralliilyticus]